MEKKIEGDKQKADDRRRRSSILKQKHKSSSVDDDEEACDTTLAKQARRVSFASSNYVKQFTADPEKVTIWDTTYEEAVSHTVDSSASQSSNKDTQSQMELTLCQTQHQQKQECRRTTIYFSDGEDIEIDEEIFENLPPELAEDKENLLIRKKKKHERIGNVSEMEFTQVITQRKEIVRQVVMYRDIEEVTMMDSVRGGEVEEMEFTECVPVEKIMVNNVVEKKVNETMKNRGNATGIGFDETTCVGGIVKVTEVDEMDESVNMHLEEAVKQGTEAIQQETETVQQWTKTVKQGTEAVQQETETMQQWAETVKQEAEVTDVRFDKILCVSQTENTDTSVRLNFSTYMNEDTQLLLNCDLSNNSKTRPHSEYSKIMMVRDYNPSPVNSKIMAMYDLSSANYSEHHVTMNNLNIDDSVNNVEVTAEVSRKTITEESFLNVTPMNGSSVTDDTNVATVETTDFVKEAMAKLIDFKPKKNVLKASDMKTWSLKMKECNQQIERYLKVVQSFLLKQLEECKKDKVELESSLLQQSSSTEETVAASETSDSGLNSTEGMEPEIPLMEKIQEKAKKARYFWKITFKGEGKCVVTTLYGKHQTFVDFDPTNGKVENVNTSVSIKDGAAPIARYITKHLSRKLSPEVLMSSLGQHYDILSFLDYVGMTFLYFVRLLDEHDELIKQYGFEIHEDWRVTFIVLSIELKLIWDVEVDFKDEILSEDCVKVRARLGTVNERAVKKCIEGCPQGFEGFRTFTSNVKNYMNSLKRPLRN